MTIGSTTIAGWNWESSDYQDSGDDTVTILGLPRVRQALGALVRDAGLSRKSPRLFVYPHIGRVSTPSSTRGSGRTLRLVGVSMDILFRLQS